MGIFKRVTDAIYSYNPFIVSTKLSKNKCTHVK